MRNYYEILGLTRDATQKEIRWSYRRLVFDCHPDTSSFGSASEEIFRLATEAFETLGDPTKRQLYDAELFGDMVRVYHRTPNGEIAIEEYADLPQGNPLSHEESLLAGSVRETGKLLAAMIGAGPVMLLSDLFFPGDSYATSLAEVWGLAIVGGGTCRALADRYGASKNELGIGGIVLGTLFGALYLRPTDDFLCFFALVKLTAAAAFGGWLGGIIAGKTVPRLMIPSRFGELLVTLAIGIVTGGLLGGAAGYLLNVGNFNESLLAALGTTPTEHLDLVATILGGTGGAIGGAILSTAVLLTSNE